MARLHLWYWQTQISPGIIPAERLSKSNIIRFPNELAGILKASRVIKTTPGRHFYTLDLGNWWANRHTAEAEASVTSERMKEFLSILLAYEEEQRKRPEWRS